MHPFLYRILTKSIGAFLNVLHLVAPKKSDALAFQIFCTPRKGKIQLGKIPKVLQTAEKEIHNIADHDIAVYRFPGNGKKILLVHGWESNSKRWKKLLPYLKKAQFDIYAIDAPAHGKSSGTLFTVPLYAEVIAAMIQKFGIQQLIAHSIGGSASIYALHKSNPETVEKAAILGAPADLDVLISNYARILSLRPRNVRGLTQTFSTKFKLETQLFSSKIFVKSLQIKGFVAHDAHDDVVAFSESEKIIANWKDVTFVPTKNLGHSLHDANLYQQLLSFLKAS
ncbi:alpha/beta hydrolase [Flavobacterium sp.]|uniref:alpha/beta fold hydrolase n=1 Tax=Flavobacterium sp. TaxID=239 RepID=UPI00262D2C5F|nr:alpha/beta hydrolase [Flavobacterium sp.]